MTPHVYRLPLSVEVRFTTVGRMLPLRVQYSEETYEIDRVLAVRRYRPPGVACIAPVEYTVLICGIEKHIYYEADSGTWFSVRPASK